MPVRITLDAFPDRVFPGQVRRIAPYVLDLEKQARTVGVEARFTDMNECGVLLPGYSADIEVVLESHSDVLRIPTEAVLEGNRVLLLDEDSVLRERAFTPGLSNWSYTQSAGGFEHGRTGCGVRGPGWDDCERKDGGRAVIRLQHIERVFQVGEHWVHALEGS